MGEKRIKSCTNICVTSFRFNMKDAAVREIILTHMTKAQPLLGKTVRFSWGTVDHSATPNVPYRRLSAKLQAYGTRGGILH